MDQKEDHKHTWKDDLSELIQKKKEENQVLKKLEQSLMQTGKLTTLEDEAEEDSTDETFTKENNNQEHNSQE